MYPKIHFTERVIDEHLKNLPGETEVARHIRDDNTPKKARINQLPQALSFLSQEDFANGMRIILV